MMDDLPEWLERARVFWTSYETLKALAVIVVVMLVAWMAAIRSRGYFKKRLDDISPVDESNPLQSMRRSVFKAGPRLAFAITLVLVIWAAASILNQLGTPSALIESFATLATAWSAIFLVTVLVHDRSWIRLAALIAYCIAGLSIFNLLTPTMDALDSVAFTVGETRVSILRMIKAAVLGALIFWMASAIARFLDHKVHKAADISPAFQELLAKSIKVVLFVVAFLLVLGLTGIDLTGIAIFGGAIGVGVGFGLQTVVSNLISGFILLLDRSIKPGDVIEIDETYGVVNTLGARYASVLTRDGTEHLIPNEQLIKQKVINWSFSDQNIRVKASIGISYESDPHQAIAICIAAAKETPRVLKSPTPTCLLRGFGDSSVDLELRFWIADPHEGVANITSAVLLNIWDAFKQNGITIPFPQRDLHLQSSAPLRVEIQPPSHDPI